ncbi:MAG: 3-phosphoshikimate 1-carboxyvinyltransferase, partial [Pseudomonadota bacterium]
MTVSDASTAADDAPPPGGPVRAVAHGPLRGSVAAPGDKSISHRALIIGALADGETRVRGLLEADDVLRTAAAMRALGARVDRDADAWRVVGGPWRSPTRALYFGNSGTGCRLTMGAAAGAGVTASFDGDGSLRARPMNRILAPLKEMGAAVESDAGALPCAISTAAGSAGAGGLRAIDYTLPTPSAQVKSAVLLAGLGAAGRTIVREPVPCRDHTERMLAAFGATLTRSPDPSGDGATITLEGGAALRAQAVDVAGDPSSAAFLVAAALATPGSDVVVKNVLMNPLRAGFFETAREMGADLAVENPRETGG